MKPAPLLLGLALLAASGCAPADRSSGEASGAASPDSVVPAAVTALRDTGSFAIGRPRDVLLTSGGRIVVSDARRRRAVAFGAAGDPLRILGGPGSGPGEFFEVSELHEFGPERVGVFDVRRRRWSLFRVETGEFVGKLPAKGSVHSVASLGDTLYYGSMRSGSRSSLEIHLPGRDSSVLAGPFPAVYEDAPVYVGFNRAVHVAPLEDGLVLAFGARNDLYFLDRDGTVRSSIALPVRRRRGVPPEVPEIFRRVEAGGAELEEAAESLSLVQALLVTEDDLVALVHEDLDWEGVPPSVKVTSRPYLTILEADGEPLCVDVPIPVEGETRPVFGSGGDTLVVLDRTPEGRAAETVVKKVPLSRGTCRGD